ncbi:hypothetical protein BC832DRAFT_588574 [Gaertneriomyces semiglobifer]|nr:hypothetical protein BC832DRAFT_588574 [Gaertneriomyces semiglobifer]
MSGKLFQAVAAPRPTTANSDRTSRARLVLDDASRKRAQERYIEELQQDNYGVNDGTAEFDLIGKPAGSKKRGTGEDDAGGATPAKRGKKSAVKRMLFQKKNFAQLVAESGIAAMPQDTPTYLTASAKPSRFPARKFCSVCGYFSRYTCVRCGVRYCCISCREAHNETRCLRYTA